MSTIRIFGIISTLILSVLMSQPLQAQQQLEFPLETIYADVEERFFRKIISKITFSFSSGWADHRFNHQIDGVGMYQSDSTGPLLIGANDPRPRSGISGWTAKPEVVSIGPKPAWGEFISKTDTSFLFSSRSRGRPFNIDATVNFRSFTFGIGFGYDLIANHRVNHTVPADGANIPPVATNLIRPTPFSSGNVAIRKYYFVLGHDVYRLRKFVLRADIRGGFMAMGKNFDKTYILPGDVLNMGLTLRRELSEYTSIFIRPSMEMTSYTLSPPGLDVDINHQIRTEFLSFGLNISIPPLPRCYITACRTQIDHAHGNRQYRSRVHPFTRKQNPGYGENKVRVKTNRAKSRKDGAVPR